MNSTLEKKPRALRTTGQLTTFRVERARQSDEMRASIGMFGEARLVVRPGEPRYTNRVESLKIGKGNVNPKPGTWHRERLLSGRHQKRRHTTALISCFNNLETP